MSEWHKSTHSGGNNECVETREYTDRADVRDTQNRRAGYLTFPAVEWLAFLADVQRGAL